MNRFTGLNDRDWQKEAQKIDTNHETYRTGQEAKIALILSLIVWTVIIYLVSRGG